MPPKRVTKNTVAGNSNGDVNGAKKSADFDAVATDPKAKGDSKVDMKKVGEVARDVENPPKKVAGKRGRPPKNAEASKITSDEEIIEKKVVEEVGATKSKKPPTKRGPKPKNGEDATKVVSDDEEEEEQEVVVKKGKVDEAAATKSKKPAVKRGGKAKSAEEAEKLVSDEEEVVVKKGKLDDTATAAKSKVAGNSNGNAKSGGLTKKRADTKAKGDSKVDIVEIEAEKQSTTDADDKDEAFDSDSKTKDGKSWNLKISSWNVAGIRAVAKKDGFGYIKKENPDIIVLEEIKCPAEELPKEMTNMPGYHSYFQATTQKDVKGKGSSYAGMGMLTKVKPIDVKYGMGIAEHDGEGRLITAEFEQFYLIGAYVPNSGRGLPRLDYRQKWNKDFLNYIKALDAKKPVIYCGDLNVAHTEIDLANPKTNTKNAGFTKEERADFTELLSNGFVDTFRYLYPKKTDAYTFWSNMNQAREKNVGWRLDYFVVSDRLKEKVCDSVMRKNIKGSDHCPLTLFLAF